MEKFLYGVGFGVVVVFIVVVLGAITAWPTMLLWNWLVPSILHLREIDFWEAWGLLILTGFLFKSTSSLSSSK